MMVLLQSKGAAVDNIGYTPLMFSSEFGQLEAVKWLIEHDVDVTSAALVSILPGTTLAASAMLLLLRTAMWTSCRFLRSRGAPFIAEAEGLVSTALHQAAACVRDECVRFIAACTCGVALEVQCPPV